MKHFAVKLHDYNDIEPSYYSSHSVLHAAFLWTPNILYPGILKALPDTLHNALLPTYQQVLEKVLTDQYPCVSEYSH